MTYFSVDVETDGPAPGLFSMVSFGAVVVREPLDEAPTFKAVLVPISDMWLAEALAISGYERDELFRCGELPSTAMKRFDSWVCDNSDSRPMFVSDNNGFDWQFINWYFHKFVGANPFGYSSTNLGSLYKGFVKDTFKNFKHLRKTAHTHDPVMDAMGNAESLVELKRMGLKIKL